MSKHPITPAEESDLRLHLAQQTNKKIGLFDILAIQQFQETPFAIDFGDHEIMLFDALKQDELCVIGEIIDSLTSNDTLFSAGSSGIGMALGAYWRQKNVLTPLKWKNATAGKAILVVSGSCSHITAAQIKFALHNGFEEISIDTVALANQVKTDFNENSSFILMVAMMYAKTAIALISKDKQVIVHTSLGNDDPRINATDQIFKQKGLNKTATAQLYGTLLGQIVKLTAKQVELKRIVIAGGDTSSYAARAMGIEAVEMMAPFSLGAPICLANAPKSAVDKLQVIFKGGQVGKPEFFVDATKDILAEN